MTFNLLRNVLYRSNYTCSVVIQNTGLRHISLCPVMFRQGIPDKPTEEDPMEPTRPKIKRVQIQNDGSLPGFYTDGCVIPTYETHEATVDGVQYKYLPVAVITATKNNTKVSVREFDMQSQLGFSTCGREGFKNAKKRSSIAQQSVGFAAGLKARKNGVTSLKIAVRGTGSGRVPAIKGLEQAGLNIVSVSDITKIPLENGPRPRKARRV